MRGARRRGEHGIGWGRVGNFGGGAPEIQVRATRELIDHLRSSYPHITHLAGHCDFNQVSVCPGRHLYPLLETLAREASLRYGTGGYVRPQY